MIRHTNYAVTVYNKSFYLTLINTVTHNSHQTFNYAFTASFNALPALNFGTVVAAI